MRIAIVGGGIFGITASIILAKNHQVELFEKNNELLQSASGSNQYRIHRGYHYPRSPDTVKDIIESENSFKEVFSDAMLTNFEHYYCIAKENSLTSAKQFLDFCNKFQLEYTHSNFFAPEFISELKVSHISFVIFFGGLVYLKIPQKINEILNKLISDIKNELDESEKLRSEAKTLLDNAQAKLDTAEKTSKDLLDQAKKESENLIIETNDKFHKSAELKKNLAENKIAQMKEAAIKEIRDTSIKIAIDSVKKIITTSVDKSKLDNLFNKNLEETKVALKKINS